MQNNFASTATFFFLDHGSQATVQLKWFLSKEFVVYATDLFWGLAPQADIDQHTSSRSGMVWSGGVGGGLSIAIARWGGEFILSLRFFMLEIVRRQPGRPPGRQP